MPPFIAASVASWMGSCKNEANFPTYQPYKIREEEPSPSLPQNYICSFAYFDVFSGCRKKAVVQWGGWHALLVPTTGTTYFVCVLGLQNPRLSSIQYCLGRCPSWQAGSRVADMGMLCEAAPEVKQCAYFESSFQHLFCIDCTAIYLPLGREVLSLIFSQCAEQQDVLERSGHLQCQILRWGHLEKVGTRDCNCFVGSVLTPAFFVLFCLGREALMGGSGELSMAYLAVGALFCISF